MIKIECAFGERLRQIRQERGLSQAKFAKKLGIGLQVLGRYETEKTMPNLSVAIEFANNLKVSLNYLAGYADMPGKLAYSTIDAQKVALAYDRADSDWKTIINKVLDIR